MWFGREYGFAFHFLNEKQTKKKELLLKEKKKPEDEKLLSFILSIRCQGLHTFI